MSPGDSPTPVPSRLTVRTFLPPCALHLATAVDAQEEVSGAVQPPPAHVALQMIIAPGAPAGGPRVVAPRRVPVGRSGEQREGQAEPERAGAGQPSPPHGSPGARRSRRQAGRVGPCATTGSSTCPGSGWREARGASPAQPRAPRGHPRCQLPRRAPRAGGTPPPGRGQRAAAPGEAQPGQAGAGGCPQPWLPARPLLESGSERGAAGTPGRRPRLGLSRGRSRRHAGPAGPGDSCH